MLQIRVVSVDGRPTASPILARFGPDGGTIGRSEGNTLVLPDDAKTVSRQHAVVRMQGGQLVLLDKGANPTLRNRVPVGPTQLAPLAIGDELRIGPYVMVVESPVPPVELPRGAIDGEAMTAYHAPAFRRVPRPIPFESSGVADASESDSGEHRSVDELFSLFDAPDSRLDVPVAAEPTPASSAGLTPPPLLVTVPPAAAMSAPPTQASESAGVRQPADMAEQSPVASTAGVASGDALLEAFFQGLGGTASLPEGLSEDFMRRMGSLLREAIKGTVDLLNARAITKREVNSGATLIAERNNNPLKFSPDPQTALLYLVSGRPNPAFMPPAAAMRDAFNDLRSHQFGMVAGTRAALEGMLERLEPQRLEQRLAGKGLVEQFIPTARKARLWDLFNELYKEISAEAEDDFHALFGRAFLTAYEEHVRSLRREMPQE
jgi:type VI secretion system FHA domain protein